VHNIFDGALFQLILEPRYHLNKKVEYSVLSTLPEKSISLLMHWNCIQDVLMYECIIWLVGKLCHSQQAIVQKSTHCAQGMDSTSEMSAIMHKGMCAAAAKF
jgi:hypothetical protein